MGGGGVGGVVGLPVGRGSERRILITATRTSSLGGTIWQCHTAAWNPVGCSLPLDAHFVHFGFVGGTGGRGSVSVGSGGVGEEGVLRATCRLFVESFSFFCFDGQCNYLLLDGGAK